MPCCPCAVSCLTGSNYFRLPLAAAELKGLRRESSLHKPQHPQPFQTLCALLPITAVSPSLQLLQEQNPTDISRAVNPTAAELLFPSCYLPGTCLLQKNCLRLEWIESELFFLNTQVHGTFLFFRRCLTFCVFLSIDERLTWLQEQSKTMRKSMNLL